MTARLTELTAAQKYNECAETAACSTCGRCEQLRRGLCHACYERGRRAGEISSSLVEATSARAHLQALIAAGWGQRRIAKAARVDRSLLRFIVLGRPVIAAKTRDAILAVGVERDEAAIEHRELCVAGMRGEYVSPQRKYRHARVARLRRGIEKYREFAGLAAELGATIDELLAECEAEKPLSFGEQYIELRDLGYSDDAIADRLGVQRESLLIRLRRNQIEVA